MSPNATPATQNEATEHWKAPKVTTFAELAIGTAILTSRGHLRTVVDGCEHLRMVAQPRANTPSTPPRVKREPLLRIQEIIRNPVVLEKIP
jgi:hypothetical protein